MTKYLNINAANFIPEKKMYWRQNTEKKALQWTQLLDLRVNFTVSKYCCQQNSYFLSLLALDDFDFLKLLQNDML